MTNTTELTDVVANWVAALTARGVTLRSRGPRGLEMLPKSAYGAMSTEERATLKQHRGEIVAVVREQHGGLARRVVVAEPTPAPAPAPDPSYEQRRQAELRKKLGWDAGVWNEQTGYRRRE